MLAPSLTVDNLASIDPAFNVLGAWTEALKILGQKMPACVAQHENRCELWPYKATPSSAKSGCGSFVWQNTSNCRGRCKVISMLSLVGGG